MPTEKGAFVAGFCSKIAQPEAATEDMEQSTSCQQLLDTEGERWSSAYFKRCVQHGHTENS
jgi:hypothetical protein